MHNYVGAVIYIYPVGILLFLKCFHFASSIFLPKLNRKEAKNSKEIDQSKREIRSTRVLVFIRFVLRETVVAV